MYVKAPGNKVPLTYIPQINITPISFSKTSPINHGPENETKILVNKNSNYMPPSTITSYIPVKYSIDLIEFTITGFEINDCPLVRD